MRSLINYSGGRQHDQSPRYPGGQIREVTVCNVATEPAARIYIPPEGGLIVELVDDNEGGARKPLPIPLQPGFAGQGITGFQPKRTLTLPKKTRKEK